MRYAIFPHRGPLDSHTVRAAYNFNHPLKIYHGLKAPSWLRDMEAPLLYIIGAPQFILDAVKRGEDDEDVSTHNLPKRKGKSIICRIFDSMGGKSTARLCWNKKLPVKMVYMTNALEDDGQELNISGKDGCSVDITLRAFEVQTLRLQL